MLSDEQLRKIEERSSKASPGPWKWIKSSDVGNPWLPGDSYCSLVRDDEGEILDVLSGINNEVVASPEDERFIAHSPTDVLGLLNTVKHYKTELEFFKKIVSDMQEESGAIRKVVMCDDLRNMISHLVSECEYHNNEYNYSTPKELIAQAKAMLKGYDG